MKFPEPGMSIFRASYIFGLGARIVISGTLSITIQRSYFQRQRPD